MISLFLAAAIYTRHRRPVDCVSHPRAVSTLRKPGRPYTRRRASERDYRPAMAVHEREPDKTAAGLSRGDEHALRQLSPFELKARLLEIAADSANRAGITMLDAGRGNPNWIATTPRAAFFLLGQFALTESQRVWQQPDFGGMVKRAGIADRFEGFVEAHSTEPGVGLLAETLRCGVSLGFDRDGFVYELADGIVGDHYPGPDRICVHAECILREYL